MNIILIILLLVLLGISIILLFLNNKKYKGGEDLYFSCNSNDSNCNISSDKKSEKVLLSCDSNINFNKINKQNYDYFKLNKSNKRLLNINSNDIPNNQNFANVCHAIFTPEEKKTTDKYSMLTRYFVGLFEKKPDITQHDLDNVDQGLMDKLNKIGEYLSNVLPKSKGGGGIYERFKGYWDDFTNWIQEKIIGKNTISTIKVWIYNWWERSSLWDKWTVAATIVFLVGKYYGKNWLIPGTDQKIATISNYATKIKDKVLKKSDKSNKSNKSNKSKKLKQTNKISIDWSKIKKENMVDIGDDEINYKNNRISNYYDFDTNDNDNQYENKNMFDFYNIESENNDNNTINVSSTSTNIDNNNFIDYNQLDDNNQYSSYNTSDQYNETTNNYNENENNSYFDTKTIENPQNYFQNVRSINVGEPIKEQQKIVDYTQINDNNEYSPYNVLDQYNETTDNYNENENNSYFDTKTIENPQNYFQNVRSINVGVPIKEQQKFVDYTQIDDNNEYSPYNISDQYNETDNYNKNQNNLNFDTESIKRPQNYFDNLVLPENNNISNENLSKIQNQFNSKINQNKNISNKKISKLQNQNDTINQNKNINNNSTSNLSNKIVKKKKRNTGFSWKRMADGIELALTGMKIMGL